MNYLILLSNAIKKRSSVWFQIPIRLNFLGRFCGHRGNTDTVFLVYVVDQKGIEILDKFENPDTDSDYQKVRIDVILLNKFLTSHTGDQVSLTVLTLIR